MIPVLESPRLILRENRKDDFVAHARIWADPRTRRYFGDTPFSEEDCWMRFLRNFGQWELYGYGYWAIIDKANGRFIGAMGFQDARRAMDVPYRDLPEAGWGLDPDYHGKGYAREAMQAAIAWADVHIAAPQSWCFIDPGNAPSRRLAQSCGYHEAGYADYKAKTVVTFLRPRTLPA